MLQGLRPVGARLVDAALHHVHHLGREAAIALQDVGQGLQHLGGSQYRYRLDLDGGKGDLFKYNTGAPFVPEPSTLALLMVTGLVVSIKRKK